jgi:cell division protease FtsH
LGKDLATEKDYSEEVAAAVDKEVSKFMSDAFKKAKTIVAKHRNALDAIAVKLIEKESIERDEFEEMMAGFGIAPKVLPSIVQNGNVADHLPEKTL